MPETVEYTWTCPRCDVQQTAESPQYVDPDGEGDICAACAEDTTECHRCHSMIWRNDACFDEDISDYDYCNACWSIITFTCAVCFETHHVSVLHSTPDGNVCGSCFEAGYRTCPNCGDVIPVEESCDCETPTRTAPMPARRILCPRPYGVEIEAGNANIIPRSAYRGTFSLQGDSSVQGDAPGELVSRKFEDDSGLEAIIKLLEKEHFQINDSCGLHLHIGPVDYDFHDLAKLWYFCMKNQPGFWLLVNPERVETGYCHQIRGVWTKPTNIYSKSAFLCWLYNTSRLQADRMNDLQYRLKKVAELKKDLAIAQKLTPLSTRVSTLTYSLCDWQASLAETKKRVARKAHAPSKYKLYIWNADRGDWRYNWLNFNSYFYRGSVEIRSHEGERHPAAVTNWIILWQQVFDYVKKTPLKRLDGAPLWEAVKIARIRDYYQKKTAKLYDQEEVEQCVGYLE